MTTLVSFDGINGNYPSRNLVADASGNIYGTTHLGGARGIGTLFELAAGTHALSTLVSFNSNCGSPQGSLIADVNGNLYGTTLGGGTDGDGTVFEIASGTHALTTLASFVQCNGTTDNPTGSLLADADGNLFGTTYSGGAYGYGTIFEVTASTHTLLTLVTFDGTNDESATPHGPRTTP